MKLGPLRKVVGYETWATRSHPRGTYSYTLTLECGHQTSRKGSVPVPERVHCRECAHDDARATALDRAIDFEDRA